MNFEEGLKHLGWTLACFVGGFIFPLLWIFAAILAAVWWTEVFGKSTAVPDSSTSKPEPARTPTPMLKQPVESRSEPATNSSTAHPATADSLKALVETATRIQSSVAADTQHPQTGSRRTSSTRSSVAVTSADLFLTKYKPRCFYHFTDTRNLEAIEAQGGLFSMRELKRLRTLPVAPGGSEISQMSDARNGMDEYVHLCLLNRNPMEWVAKNEGRIKESAFLEISSSILRTEGLLLTSGFSNKSGIVPVSLEEALDGFDFDILYGKIDWNDPGQKMRHKIAWKYEMLVPRFIPLSSINNWDRVIHGARNRVDFDDDIPF